MNRMAAEGLSALRLYLSKELLKKEDLEEAVEEGSRRGRDVFLVTLFFPGPVEDPKSI